MGDWSRDSRAHVATMTAGDFRETERSVTVDHPGSVRIEHVDPRGEITVLKERTDVLAGEILDAAVMRRAALDQFLAEQLADARDSGVLFSVHLKATMMKVSDPIIFGHASG
jgi:isocitrate dehydrogenase